jgi:glycosyltransferase 2 family protein
VSFQEVRESGRGRERGRAGRGPGSLTWGAAAVGLACTVVFAYLAVKDVEFDLVWQSLRSSNYWWLVPAFGALVVAVVLRALRWRYLFAAARRPPVWPVTEALLIGQFFNTILPARAGELARVVALNLRSGTSRAETLATVVVERSFDVLAILVLLFLALPWLPDVSWLKAAVILASVLAAGLVAAALVLARYGSRPLAAILSPLARLPFVRAARVEWAAVNLTEGLAGLRSVRLGAISFALTLVSWLVLAFSFWLVMRGFGLELSIGAGLLVAIATGLSLILPSGPAALGVFEAATVVALSAYDVPESRALSYALVLHALNSLPFLAAGVVLLNLRGAIAGRRLLGGAERPRVDEDDVPQPTDRDPDVGQLGEPNGHGSELPEARREPVGDVRGMKRAGNDRPLDDAETRAGQHRVEGLGAEVVQVRPDQPGPAAPPHPRVQARDVDRR